MPSEAPRKTQLARSAGFWSLPSAVNLATWMGAAVEDACVSVSADSTAPAANVATTIDAKNGIFMGTSLEMEVQTTSRAVPLQADATKPEIPRTNRVKTPTFRCAAQCPSALEPV